MLIICFLFCANKLSYEELIKSLKSSYQDLLKKKKIQLNKESKAIISSFNSNIDKNLNYINEIKGSNFTFKKLDEEKEEINIQLYLEKIKKLEKEELNIKVNYMKRKLKFKIIKRKRKN